MGSEKGLWQWHMLSWRNQQTANTAGLPAIQKQAGAGNGQHQLQLLPGDPAEEPASAATDRLKCDKGDAAEAPGIGEGHQIQRLDLAAVPPVLPHLWLRGWQVWT